MCDYSTFAAADMKQFFSPEQLEGRHREEDAIM